MNLNRKTPFAALLTAAVLAFTPARTSAAGNDTSKVEMASVFGHDAVSGLVGESREIRAGLLYDVDRNTIVWEKDMDYAYPIASLTKMMVGLLAMEDIHAGRVRWDDCITVSRSYRKRIRRGRYTTITREEHYTFEDVVKMAMIASHNESTVWIARHCSGDLQLFVERMNRRAQELGMTKTLYSNPSGLPAIIDELDNSSSPRDQLVLALEILKHPKLVEITSIPYLTVHNGKGHVNYRNHNGLVINYGMEVDGIKTGYTKAAGFCLVGTARRGGQRLISVIYGCSSPWVRNGIVANMMNRYYESIKLGRLGETLPDLTASRLFVDSVSRGLASITVAQEEKAQLPEGEDANTYAYKTIREKVRKSITVKRGDNLGSIAQRYNVTVSDLRKWNRLKGSTIHPGQKLAVYTTVKKTIPIKVVADADESIADLAPSIDTCSINADDCPEESLADSQQPFQNGTVADSGKSTSKPATLSKPANQEPQRFIYHVVQRGDTLWNIAQRYRLSPNQIKELNNIGNSNLLRKGERLKIPKKG